MIAFLSMTPLDILKETFRQFPAVLVAKKPNYFLQEVEMSPAAFVTKQVFLGKP